MYMFKYILKRIGLMLMTFTIIFVMCFVLIKLLPVDLTSVGFGQERDSDKEDILNLFQSSFGFTLGEL